MRGDEIAQYPSTRMKAGSRNESSSADMAALRKHNVFRPGRAPTTPVATAVVLRRTRGSAVGAVSAGVSEVRGEVPYASADRGSMAMRQFAECGMSETDRTPYGISVAGDSTVDWGVAEPPGRVATGVDTRYAWQTVAWPRVARSRGGRRLIGRERPGAGKGQ